MLTELELEIKKHRKLYWEDSNPEISDEEYDVLLEKLREIDPNNFLLIEPETGEEEIADTDKVFHSVPMLSLEKKFSYDEVRKWMDSVARIPGEVFICTPKFDGCASRYYKDSSILSTRGNGQFGQNITDKIPLIINIDFKTIKPNVLDGEVLISIEDFKNCKLVKKDSKTYKNPRNLVSGILNLKDISLVINKVILNFITYDTFKIEFISDVFTKDFFNTFLLEKLKDCPYPLDGLVFKLKDNIYGTSLGFTGHHYKNAIAFKDKDRQYKTKIKEIILQHGKAKLTPVAILEPTIISGVTVTRASLHNAKNILDNDIQLGDDAWIIRSGDVIPYIVKTEPGIVRFPPVFNKCPICQSELIYKEPDLFCSKIDCTGNLIKRLAEATKSIEIDNLGEPTIEKMVYELNIENLVDILNLDFQDILELEGFSFKSANKLLQNITNVKSATEDYKLLAALNIPGIGMGLFKKIMSKVNIDELLATTVIDLMGFDNLGYDRSFNICSGLLLNANLLQELRSIINVIETKQCIGNTVRPKVCFSGNFVLPKDFYQRIANSKGYEVVTSVTKDLNLLVTSGAITNKYTKAQQYGIKVIDVDEFLNS